ncbi:unnamed protein product [Linum trigynum]|uniref:Uncharacterized protein n=1 Tax=Linum trigynum TaxID=586398 RepID=A0AAV2CUB1_9ROSI
MGRICSGMMISTPLMISKLDLMKPISKIASRMCSSHFLSLGLCFCSEKSISSLVARIWVKTRIPDSYWQVTRPCGLPRCPCESQNAEFRLIGLQATYTVRDTRPCRISSLPL